MSDPTGMASGTIVVEARERQRHLVLPGGKAVRYGDEAHGWTGTATIAQGRMAGLDPAGRDDRALAARARDGGRPRHPPLGARALYLSDHGRDTLYRIHRINEPEKSAARYPPAASACATST